MIRAFIQARMSSSRFPGKVLAPLGGRPSIAHVLDRAAEAVGKENVVLLTSDHETDDPLAGYVSGLGYAVFRGPLDDVAERFRLCLDAHPCEWFFRISGDSPLLDIGILRRMIDLVRDDLDLVTNTQPRTFPKGQSAELVKATAFRSLADEPLTAAEREHVTPGFYARPNAYKILSVTAAEGTPAGVDTALDTLEDLARLEQLLGG